MDKSFILAHLEDGTITQLDSSYLPGSEGSYRVWLRSKGSMISYSQDPDEDDYIELSQPEIVIGWEHPGDCGNSYHEDFFCPEDGEDWIDQAIASWHDRIDYCDSQR
nr:MAG TPA: hypothetical protein [Caudoviricetes sp.]